MAGNPIPTKSRLAVKARDADACQRCGQHGTDWHHRRRRAVKLGHNQHCPCNGVLLCSTCHRWAHANPSAAKATGFIIAPHEDEPWTIPLLTYGGWQINTCDGDYDPINKPKEPQ